MTTRLPNEAGPEGSPPPGGEVVGRWGEAVTGSVLTSVRQRLNRRYQGSCPKLLCDNSPWGENPGRQPFCGPTPSPFPLDTRRPLRSPEADRGSNGNPVTDHPRQEWHRAVAGRRPRAPPKRRWPQSPLQNPSLWIWGGTGGAPSNLLEYPQYFGGRTHLSLEPHTLGRTLVPSLAYVSNPTPRNSNSTSLPFPTKSAESLRVMFFGGGKTHRCLEPAAQLPCAGVLPPAARGRGAPDSLALGGRGSPPRVPGWRGVLLTPQ